MFLRKGALKICTKFTGEHPCWSMISINLQSSFIEIRLWRGHSPLNLLHIFRTPFPRNTHGWLLLKVWRSKGNQTMKFGQLIGYNIKNTFLQNCTQRMEEKLVPDPFVNIKVESISGSAVWNVIKFAFIVCPRQSLSKCFKTNNVTICFCLIYSLFKTQKVIWN